VVAEILKAYRNAGQPSRLSQFRDAHGLEVDLFVEQGKPYRELDAVDWLADQPLRQSIRLRLKMSTSDGA
jgi:hypothetical protein